MHLPKHQLALLCIMMLFSSAIFSASAYSITPTDKPISHQEIPRYPNCEANPEPDEICEILRDWTLDELEAHANTAFWTEGDVANFAFQGAFDNVFVVGDISTALRPVPASDWWALSVRVPRLAEAILNIGLLTVENGQLNRQLDTVQTWRGPDAPPISVKADPLEGEVQTITIDSTHVGAREVSIYLPPDHDSSESYPVVYMVDGQLVSAFAPYIEPLIVSGDLPALLLVGAHAVQGTGPNDDRRALEYLPDFEGGEIFFNAHQAFFMEDLLPWAEKTMGASNKREERAVFGLSNGAAFSAWLAQTYPDHFGNSIVFSLGWEIERNDDPALPIIRHYLLAGTLETHFHQATRAWLGALEQADDDVIFTERVAGHNMAMWQEEFPSALLWTFGNSIVFSLDWEIERNDDLALPIMGKIAGLTEYKTSNNSVTRS